MVTFPTQDRLWCGTGVGSFGSLLFSTQVEHYETLGDLFRVYETMQSPLSRFRWLLSWPSLTDSERGKQYVVGCSAMLSWSCCLIRTPNFDTKPVLIVSVVRPVPIGGCYRYSKFACVEVNLFLYFKVRPCVLYSLCRSCAIGFAPARRLSPLD